MGNEMGNNNTSSLKEVKDESVRVDALDGSSHETVKENDVKGDHLIAEDEGKDVQEKSEDLAFHHAITGDSNVDQLISGPQVLSQATNEVNEGDRNVEEQPELFLVNPEHTEPSMESDVGDRDKISSQLNIEAANIEVENGETSSSLTVLGDLGTQISEGVKTDPLGLDKVDVGISVSSAWGSEVSREDFLGSPSTFLAEGNDSVIETETPSSVNVPSLCDANIEFTHLKLEQEQVEGDKASNVERLIMSNENQLEDRTASNFLNFGHEEKLNEATTVSGSTLQSKDSVADHSRYLHPEVSGLEDQSGLVMEEIESTSSRLVNEANIKWDDGPVGHSDEPCYVQPEMAEAKDVSEMVFRLESITDDAGNTVEVPLDCPSDKECKVKATDVTENGFQDETGAEASNFLNFGHKEKPNEATTVSGSTLQSEDFLADHSQYLHPEVSKLEEQSGLIMEEIESTSSRLVNEANINWDDGPVEHSDEPCYVQPEKAEAKDVSEMVFRIESVTDDVGNTVEVSLDCPSDKECKVKVTDVTENGFQDEIGAEASDFLNFGHEEKPNEATTVSSSTLQPEDIVADHPPYSHPGVLELKEQSVLDLEEIEFTGCRLMNENDIKCDNSPVGHSNEPHNVQPGMAEAKDVSKMVVGLESITEDVRNTVEAPLDCPSDMECKVMATDVTENGFQDEIHAEASEGFSEYIEGEDYALPISIEPEAGDTNHDKKEPTEKELIEDKHVERELCQANADDTSRKHITEQFIPVHFPHICDSFSSVDHHVMISPVSQTKASGDQCNSESQQCQMPVTSSGGDTELEKLSGSLSTGLKSYNDTHIHPQLQKFPSFDFDLLMGSRSEESDQTPLLFPDRSTFRSLSVKGRCDRAKQVDCLEEKTVRMDRSDTEKSKTLFLGSSKTEQEDDEKQEAHVVSTSQKQVVKEADTKASRAMWVVTKEEVGSTSPKGKEKRKFRSSLFGNCMCCATVIN